MRHTQFRAFTLVEMLIVIVIIGILIAALMPRLQGAQGRARDVARQADLSQIQTAIINYQTQRGEYPWSGNDYTKAIGVTSITDKLTSLGGLNGVPTDPNLSNTVTGLGGGSTPAGEYAYLIMKKNQIQKNGFVLMARVETEGGANRVSTGNVGKIGDNGVQDVSKIIPCISFEEGPAATGNAQGLCKYSSPSELRYILTF